MMVLLDRHPQELREVPCPLRDLDAAPGEVHAVVGERCGGARSCGSPPEAFPTPTDDLEG
jgi:hypothetical protein